MEIAGDHAAMVLRVIDRVPVEMVGVGAVEDRHESNMRLRREAFHGK